MDGFWPLSDWTESVYNPDRDHHHHTYKYKQLALLPHKTIDERTRSSWSLEANYRMETKTPVEHYITNFPCTIFPLDMDRLKSIPLFPARFGACADPFVAFRDGVGI